MPETTHDDTPAFAGEHMVQMSERTGRYWRWSSCVRFKGDGYSTERRYAMPTSAAIHECGDTIAATITCLGTTWPRNGGAPRAPRPCLATLSRHRAPVPAQGLADHAPNAKQPLGSAAIAAGMLLVVLRGRVLAAAPVVDPVCAVQRLELSTGCGACIKARSTDVMRGHGRINGG